MGTNNIPATVVAAIKKCWSQGEIEEFDTDESYFHSIRQSLERDLRSIPGAAILWQTEEGENDSQWDSDLDGWEDEPPPSDEPWCSYHVFFLAPKGSEFHFEDETESVEYDEDTGEEVSPDETVPGEGWIGCAVAISLAARVAAVNLASYSQFEDGSQHCPDIESDQPYREALRESTLGALEQLRKKLSAALKKHRIHVLEPAILDLPIPDLTACEEVFLQPPLRVRDAFFFRGA